VTGTRTRHSTAVGTGGSSTTSPATTSSPATTTPPATTTTVGQVPTVPNCGGGAYEPKTLLIVCGSGTAMATGVSWRSWTAAAASGTGTVHLVVNDRATSALAEMTLDQVVNGPVGPQFSRLTVTWTGPSPDGKTQDIYRLQPG
jgi:hypothetical protein